jgi:hypothetical protein
MYTGEKQQGSQFDYSEKALEIMKIKLPVPDHSTLSKRSKSLEVKLPRRTRESVNFVLDSTGLKVYGEGKWKVRQQGYSKYRTWHKLQLAAISTMAKFRRLS